MLRVDADIRSQTDGVALGLVGIPDQRALGVGGDAGVVFEVHDAPVVVEGLEWLLGLA